MSQPAGAPEPMTRDAMIEALRSELLRRSHGDMSICRLAAQAGIFCNGFRRFSDVEFRRRYGWIAKRYRGSTRAELEQIADLWQQARQEALSLPTSCDVQMIDHDSCNGWDDFTNEELAKFLFDLTGRSVAVDAG